MMDLSIICFLLVLNTFTVKSQNNKYIIDSHENCNNIYGAVKNADQSTEYVRYLGIFSSTNDCIQSCISNTTTHNRCESYTYHTSKYSDKSFQSHCYGRFGTPYGLLWTPAPDKEVNCGRIIYPCTSDLDCELNGKCNTQTGNCTCHAAWSGYHCQSLNLLPATKGTGYHITNDNNSGKPTSSWGGAVLMDPNDKNEKTKYHMYLAEFDNHCGVNSWTLNSVVSHAQSINGYNSAFERVDVIHPHFAHEPDAIFGPNGEIVLFYSAYNYTMPECQCSDGSTPKNCTAAGFGNFINMLTYSIKPYAFNGPWESTVVWPDNDPVDTDTNLAGVFLPNGTFVGMYRYWEIFVGSQLYVTTTDNWKDGKSYSISNEKLFPNLVPLLTEDPFLYIDCDGNFHGIFHNMSPNNIQAIDGGHAYSQNGIDWIYGGYSYGNSVKFTDGSSQTFSRRERPHFVFDDDGCTPIALTTGTQYGGEFGDATYTLLQPIVH